MHTHSSATTPPSIAEQLYARWRLELEVDAACSFDELCALHPESATELRALHGAMEGLHAVEVQARLRTAEEASSRAASLVEAELRGYGASTERYLVGEVLGRGGMGEVRRAEDRLLQRQVAYKILLEPELRLSRLPLLRREMLLAARLSHPNIVPVWDAGLDGAGRAFYTMPLIVGRNLSDVYRSHAKGESEWSQARVVSLLLQVAETMAYAHRRGVVHRDLKPGNIRVGEHGEVHVMDWGIAKLVDEAQGDEHAQAPAPSDLSGGAGTAPYMSPEQWRAGGAVGPASDVHALGVMLYELLAGRPPYHAQGEPRLKTEVLRRRMQAGPPAPIRVVAAGQSPELCSICERAMEREVDRRYADCSALAADLRAYLEGRVVSAHATGAWIEARKWVGRNKALASSMGLFVAALLAGTVVAWTLYGSAELARSEAVSANARLGATNVELRELLREQRLLGLQEELDRFERQCGSLDGLERLADWPGMRAGSAGGAAEWWLAQARRLLSGSSETEDLPGLPEVRARLDSLRATEALHDHGPLEQALDLESFPDEQLLERLESRRRDLEEDCDERVAKLKALWTAKGLLLGLIPVPEVDATSASLVGAGSNPGELLAAAREVVEADLGPADPVEAATALARARLAVQGVDQRDRARALLVLSKSLAWSGRAREARAAFDESAALQGVEEDGARTRKLLALLDQLASPEVARHVEEWRRWESSLAQREAALRSSLPATAARLDQRIAELRRSRSARRTWRFKDAQADWLHARLVEVERRLARLEALLPAVEASCGTPRALAAWDEAARAIAASPAYAGVRWPGGAGLRPQVGLLPLGEDPRSGLWEFVHLASGEPPSRGLDGELLRDDDGSLLLDEQVGLVFVLVPGGRVPKAFDGSQPDWLVAVELAPYFLSKHEMAREQWNRLSTRRGYDYGGNEPLGPINYQSHVDASDCLSRSLDWMRLPTEAQWELACRAGTSTRWWTGDAADSLAGFELIGATTTLLDAPLGDALAIGAMRPNAFGFHDMAGLMQEWCADTHYADAKPRPGDGLREDGAERTAWRSVRGGHVDLAAEKAASSARHEASPGYRSWYLGVRPARSVTP